MTWEEIVQIFIDSAGTPGGPTVSQQHLSQLNAGNVNYATARNIVQQYSLSIAGQMTTAYKNLASTARGATFSSTAFQATQSSPVVSQGMDAIMMAVAAQLSGGGDKGPPLGWYESRQEAVSAARRAYGGEKYDELDQPLPPAYDIINKNGLFSFVGKEKEAESDQRWTIQIDRTTGDLIAIDLNNPTATPEVVSAAPTKAPEGAVKIGKPIDIGGGKFLQPYAVTDKDGNTVRTNVTIEGTPDAPTEEDIVTFGEDGAGGRLIPLGDGRYTYEAPPDAVFTTGPDDVVSLPKQGGSLIKTSKNQYQFVRDTYEPGVKIDPQTGRQFVQSASGTWTELDPRFQQGVVESGGRQFLQQTTGALAELDPRYTPEVTDVDGMSLLQQRSGAISQLAKPNLDQIITQALVDGEYDKAFAFQDFRDRPTAQETFNTALEFARSPADQILISSIARGEQTVQPPPAGTIQRVGPQADFLVQAYQDFQRRTQAGRAPTEEEATGLSARAAEGASPLTDTLQARLESMTRDQERKDEEHAVKMQGLIQKQNEEAQLFETKLNIAKGLDADGSPKVTDTTSASGLFSGTEETGAKGAGASTTAGRQALCDFQSGEYDGNWETWAEAQGFFREAGAGMSSPLSRGDAAGIAAGMMRDKGITDPAIIMAEIERFANSNLATLQSTQSAMQTDDAPADIVPKAPPVTTVTPATETAAPIPSSIGGMTSGQWTVSNILDEMGRGRIDGGTGALDVYGEGTTFADVAAAVGEPVTATNLAAETAREQASMKTERMDLASNLAAARSGAGGPTDWKSDPGVLRAERAIQAVSGVMPPEGGFRRRAGGGTVRPGEITVVVEQCPEIAMMPPGTHILPLGRATKQDIKAAQATGRAYQQGGIVFGELPFGIRQLQAGRPITPSRGYLSQAAGLTLPSAQALSNLTPESRDVYFDLARQAGIPSRAFGQELQTAMPSGRRLPTSRMLPFSSRGVR